MMAVRFALVLAILTVSPASAQVRQAQSSETIDQEEEQQRLLAQQRLREQASRANEVGRVARSSVGQVGQRQTQASLSSVAGIKPNARLAGRLQTRVRNRIQSRIDRYYQQSNVTDPFAVAEDQSRSGGRGDR